MHRKNRTYFLQIKGTCSDKALAESIYSPYVLLHSLEGFLGRLALQSPHRTDGDTRFSLKHEDWWWRAFANRWLWVCWWRWMFGVGPASPPTPQIPSMMNHSGPKREHEMNVHVGGSVLRKTLEKMGKYGEKGIRCYIYYHLSCFISALRPGVHWSLCYLWGNTIRWQTITVTSQNYCCCSKYSSKFLLLETKTCTMLVWYAFNTINGNGINHEHLLWHMTHTAVDCRF